MAITTPPTFPTLPGQTWSVHKRPTFSTRVASHTSGREVRRSNYARTLYEFEVSFEGLDSAGAFTGLQAQSLQALMGLYLAAQGQFGTFLYTDPSDSVATDQIVGTGDGSTTAFPLARTLGGWTEPVGWVTQLGTVSVAGAAQGPSAYALGPPNILTFTTAPAAGAPIAASFAYAFVCRFLDDQEDFENIMSGLWQLQSLKFRSVRTS